MTAQEMLDTPDFFSAELMPMDYWDTALLVAKRTTGDARDLNLFDMRVFFGRQGLFTFCHLDNGDTLTTGVTRCNTQAGDEYDPERGQLIALNHAVRSFLEK
jgi:hypothetical protein